MQCQASAISRMSFEFLRRVLLSSSPTTKKQANADLHEIRFPFASVNVSRTCFADAHTFWTHMQSVLVAMYGPSDVTLDEHVVSGHRI